MALVTINGRAIADPSDIEVGQYRISKAERTAAGKMMMEIIAIKRSVTLKYNLISEAALKTILDELESKTFHTLTYPDPQGSGGAKTITVYVGDIKESAWQTVGGVRYWRDVSIGLVEQ
ncbi:hypothetical protein CTH_2253 [Carboxydocella thermautotrophica]|nr:hypothetical protein CTH_2253 [Carboxydocella thermautotrophica]